MNSLTRLYISDLIFSYLFSAACKKIVCIDKFEWHKDQWAFKVSTTCRKLPNYMSFEYCQADLKAERCCIVWMIYDDPHRNFQVYGVCCMNGGNCKSRPKAGELCLRKPFQPITTENLTEEHGGEISEPNMWFGSREVFFVYAVLSYMVRLLPFWEGNEKMRKKFQRKDDHRGCMDRREAWDKDYDFGHCYSGVVLQSVFRKYLRALLFYLQQCQNC